MLITEEEEWEEREMRERGGGSVGRMEARGIGEGRRGWADVGGKRDDWMRGRWKRRKE